MFYRVPAKYIDHLQKCTKPVCAVLFHRLALLVSSLTKLMNYTIGAHLILDS